MGELYNVMCLEGVVNCTVLREDNSLDNAVCCRKAILHMYVLRTYRLLGGAQEVHLPDTLDDVGDDAGDEECCSIHETNRQDRGATDRE
jgi:hypothetical protein